MTPSARLARELIRAHGWNSTSHQILNPGITHWFSEQASAMVGYVRRANVLLVAGAPVCDGSKLADISSEFEQFARAQGCRVCYVCAGERMREATFSVGGYSTVVIGAQPVWDPRTWPDMLRTNAVLRQQINRARNKGVEVEVAGPRSAAHMAELAGVLKEWLRGRALPPLHFLADPAILDSVTEEQKILVARRCGRAVAFAIASPVGARRGYLVELLARSSAAPNGTSELLIDAAMRNAAANGASYMTLGLVALARAADRESAGNPLWLQWLMRFARAHANRFYRFRGLEYFRAKLAPEAWEPVYAISNERRFSISTMYALGGAFSGISPWRAIGIGAVKAARAECDTLREFWIGALGAAASRIAPREEAG